MIRALALLAALMVAPVAQAAPAPAQLVGPAETFHAAGTEPFWGAEVRGTRMKLETPDNERGRALRVRRSATGSRATFSGAGPDGPFTMTVIRRTCSDGMSERSYRLEVAIKFRNHTMQGCGWTTRLPFRVEE